MVVGNDPLSDVRPQTAAMQGGGFYNRNSRLQEANITSALPLLEEAAATVPLDDARPVTIVDYGASQGRNSMRPIRAAIDIVRARAGSLKPVEVIHTDLPSNDFTSLFQTLATDKDSYLAGQAGVFASAIGRSYFDALTPPDRVDLGWSANALHWLGGNPVDVPDHGWAVFSASAEARAAVERQQDADWRAFLTARSAELRKGGRIVCQFLGRGAESHGFEWMAGAFWDCWVEMGREGWVSAEELLRMTCPSAGRSEAQIRAPFAGGGFAGLTIERLAIVDSPDPYWDQYQQSGDAEALGRSWATMMRAANGPNFAAGLRPDRDQEMLFDEMTRRLAARIAAAPQRSRSHIVLLTLVRA